MDILEEVINTLIKISISKYVAAFMIILISFVFNRYVITRIFDYIIRLAKRTKNLADDSLAWSLEKPIKLYITLYAVYASLIIIDFDGLNFNSLTSDKIKRLFIVIAICYFFYNLTLENSLLYSKLKKNDIVFPFVSIVIRLLIVIIGISCIAREFGFTGFIAGLGISGVAFALMAQDAFSNLFGGMIIVLDRPFAIGDWIQTPQIEGIVEDITFRSTKVRTFTMSVATIPNSKLANEEIINWSERKLRRIHFKFTIKSNTPIKKIRSLLDKIKEYLNNHEKIDKDLIIVSFNDLSNMGYGVFMYFYTNEMNFIKYEELREEINIRILEMVEEEEVELMFMFNFAAMNNNNNNSNNNNAVSNLREKCQEIESMKKINEELGRNR
ncbi:MAG: mechanosensitive ion channel family protein [Clostridium sp.]|uniref:mechanosensitive ion channel family protein n=1 Tax=Clostridium sp. TaxID=1506 RepID=UPI00290B10AC|nr:mechanosensitive ion channel family protein [Clostridium sp.]MDU5111868.1 mechanosensitive ion channel family protein [Clostridium sp.]